MTSDAPRPQAVWLAEGIAAAQRGERARARSLLIRLIGADPTNQEAWLWLSGVVDSPADQRRCLQRVLDLNPDHAAARRGLAALKEAALQEAALQEATDPAAAVDPAASEQAAAVDSASRFVDTRPPPVVVHQSESDYDDVWSRSDDICAFCAAPVAFEDQRCPQCRRPLEVTAFRYPRSSPNLHVYWVMILATAQLFVFQVARDFALASVELRALWAGLALVLLLLPIGIIRRWLWAYALSLLALVVVAMLATNTILNGRLLGDFRLNTLPEGAEEHILDRLVTTPLLAALLVVSIIALLLGIFLVSPDFDRVKRRRLARLSKGVTEAHHFFETGQRAAQHDMWASAVLHWQRAAARDPHRLLYLRTLGEGYARLGFYDRSLDMLGAAASRASTDEARAEIARLRRQVQQQQLDAAVTGG